MGRIKFNQSVSFLKKEETYAFYVDFHFLFLRGVAARLMDALLKQANEGGFFDLIGVPDEFINFLLSRKILIEENKDES